MCKTNPCSCAVPLACAIPEWAKIEAVKRVNEFNGTRMWSAANVGKRGNGAVTILAETIAKYEQPPVPPELLAAREQYITWWEVSKDKSRSSAAKNGSLDKSGCVESFLAGVEWARNNTDNGDV